MKRFVGLFVATVAAVALPLSAAGASPASTTPNDYQAGCEQAYQGGKALFDAIIASPLKALTGPLEKGICGENKHS